MINDIYERRNKTKQDTKQHNEERTRQDKTRQDKTRHDTIRHDKTRQDKTRQDKMGWMRDGSGSKRQDKTNDKRHTQKTK